MNLENHSMRPGIKAILTGLTFVLLPLFFIGGPGWADGPLYKAAWNLGHILFFFILTLLIRPQHWLGGWRLITVTTLVVFTAGGLIELLQGKLGRSVSWHDIARDLIGAWLALAWLSWPRQRRCVVWLARFVVLALLLRELWPVVAVGLQQWQLTRQIPQLYDFTNDSDNAQAFWDGNVQRSTRYADELDGQFSLKVSIGTGRYSGASLDNLASDWSNYQSLALTLFNPEQQPLAMTLRINDRAHDRGNNAYEDRFNTRLVIAPGLNRFTISLTDVQQAPATRLMTMTDIRRLLIFASNQATPTSVYLLELRLQ